MKENGCCDQKKCFKSINSIFIIVFLGARGVTSWEINELLRLDEMISFNPHLMYKSVTDDLETNEASDFVSACFKTLVVDKVSISKVYYSVTENIF